MPRLFTALEIPEADAARLAGLRAALPGARWVEPGNYHITLRFFGDVEPNTADALIEQLAEATGPTMALQLRGLGSFGGDRPRTLWVGVDAGGDTGTDLAALAARHERLARAVGLPAESRNFHPHVTLARFAAGERARQLGPRRRGRGPTSAPNTALLSALEVFLATHGGFVGTHWEASRFVLMSSRSGTGGGPYVIEATYPLGEVGAATPLQARGDDMDDAAVDPTELDEWEAAFQRGREL